MLATNKSLQILASTLAALVLSPYSAAFAKFHVDEIDYCKKLESIRPTIMGRQDRGSYDALVIAPQFRAAMLTKPNTYATLKNRCYTPYWQNVEKTWVMKHLNAQLDLQTFLHKQFLASYPTGTDSQYYNWLAPQNIVKPAYYHAENYIGPDNYFVGYYVGPTQNIEDPITNIDYKIFFNLKHPFIELTPDVYREFSQTLLDAGFWGDSKLPDLRPQENTGSQLGQTFMQYNQIILHAHSAQLAKLAEQVGQQYFAKRNISLAHMGRGIDADKFDWHTYLVHHKGDISGLPPDAQNFVLYKD